MTFIYRLWFTQIIDFTKESFCKVDSGHCPLADILLDLIYFSPGLCWGQNIHTKIYVVTESFRQSGFVFSVHTPSPAQYILFISLPGRTQQYPAIPIDFIVKSLELEQSETIRMDEFIRQMGTENFKPLYEVAAKFSVSSWGSIKGTRRWPLPITFTSPTALLASPRLHAVMIA